MPHSLLLYRHCCPRLYSFSSSCFRTSTLVERHTHSRTVPKTVQNPDNTVRRLLDASDTPAAPRVPRGRSVPGAQVGAGRRGPAEPAQRPGPCRNPRGEKRRAAPPLPCPAALPVRPQSRTRRSRTEQSGAGQSSAGHGSAVSGQRARPPPPRSSARAPRPRYRATRRPHAHAEERGPGPAALPH